MGVEPVETFDGPDPHILKSPKAVLASLWTATVLWAGYKVYFTEVSEEERVIRLVYMVIMSGLIGLIVINQKWAMTNAYAVFLSYMIAPFFFDIQFFVWSLHLVWFGGLLTLRSFLVSDDLRSQTTFERAQKFE